MPKFAANLTMMYTEWPFLERFQAAAEDGFSGVEFMAPYAHPAAEIAARLEALGLVLAVFNTPAGNMKAGERGFASLPGREDDYRKSIELALEYARRLACKSVHVISGVIPADAPRAPRRAVYVKNLAWAAQQAARDGITLVIEPINTRNIPGYFLNHQAEAHAVCAEIDAPNLKVQMDFYHCQMSEGDLATKLKKYAPKIGHMQIAGVPERHEPDGGEVNYAYLYDLIDALGYAGWVGCEYRPRNGTRAGLGWFARWRQDLPSSK